MIASELVHKVSEAIGIKPMHSDSMNPDYFRRVFAIMVDSIRSINQQEDIVFGYDLRTMFVAGDKLTFKPYTAAEQAIIDGGGSVDITDRIVDIRPCSAPTIVINSQRQVLALPSDIKAYGTMACTYAWVPGYDKDEVIFPSALSKNIDLTIRKPIAVPSTPLSVIEVPDRFFSFLVATISYNAATAFGLADRAKMQQEIAANERRAVGTNNAKARPQILVPVVSRFD